MHSLMKFWEYRRLTLPWDYFPLACQPFGIRFVEPFSRLVRTSSCNYLQQLNSEAHHS